MLIRRAFVVIVLLGCMVFQVPQARAQWQACAEVIWDYIGAPLTAGMLSEAGKQFVDHFSGRVQNGETTTIQKSDITQLEQDGMTPCEIRRRLEAMGVQQEEPPSPPRIGYSAQAHCPITGAIGIARGEPTPEDALELAAQDCIRRGGVPQCCYKESHLTD